MNTTLMHAPRQISTGPLRNKRKEGDGGADVFKPSKLPRPSFVRPSTPPKPKPQPPKPVSDNRLLAGYLAHEFLTKGTLFGAPWDPARAEAVPVSAERRRSRDPSPSRKDAPAGEKRRRYAEVANLLREDGAHLPGIVNPTQLARFLQL